MSRAADIIMAVPFAIVGLGLLFVGSGLIATAKKDAQLTDEIKRRREIGLDVLTFLFCLFLGFGGLAVAVWLAGL